MNILSLWLKGMLIIMQFLFVLTGMIVIATLLWLWIDSIVEEITGKSMLANILFGCRTHEEVLEKLKQKIKDKRKKM